MKYGYIRVSSADQSVARQVDALREAGVEESNIFTDRMSGKDFNRPAWAKLVRKLKEDDLLVVLSLDRLGRNYEDINEQWRIIIKVKKANIRVLDMPLLDTTNKANDLVGTVVADLVLQLLSFLAESERKNIHERQRQGIEAAKKRGVRFGRPRKVTDEELRKCVHKMQDGSMTLDDAAQSCRVSTSTIRRRVRAWGDTSHQNDSQGLGLVDVQPERQSFKNEFRAPRTRVSASSVVAKNDPLQQGKIPRAERRHRGEFDIIQVRGKSANSKCHA